MCDRGTLESRKSGPIGFAIRSLAFGWLERGGRSPLMGVQKVELSKPLLLADRFAKRAMQTAKTAERLNVAEEVYDTWMLFAGRGDHDEQLPARSQLRQTGFEI